MRTTLFRKLKREEVLFDIEYLAVLMEQFQQEFTKNEYDDFAENYHSYKYREGKTWKNLPFDRDRLDAPILLTLPSLLKRGVVKITRTEPAGRGKRNYYKVNLNYFEDVMSDIEDLMSDIKDMEKMLYNDENKHVREGRKIVSFLKNHQE